MSLHIKITRKDGIFDVYILKNKLENSYSFVNITKGHICPCKFDTIAEAIDDLDKYVNIGKVIKYEFIR